MKTAIYFTNTEKALCTYKNSVIPKYLANSNFNKGPCDKLTDFLKPGKCLKNQEFINTDYGRNQCVYLTCFGKLIL